MWLCRLFGHQSMKRSLLAEKVWGPSSHCFRCGAPLDRKTL